MAETFDVIVIGGGPAGVPAAVQAARLGARTLLVEKQCQLGGTTTLGGVTAIQTFFAYGRQIIAGIGWEIVCRSFDMLGRPRPTGGTYNPDTGVTNTFVDSVAYSCALDQAVLDSGAQLRLHTTLGAAADQGDHWRLTLCGKEGLADVRARVAIDCTGDANLVRLAGLEIVCHATRQPGTLVFTLEGGYHLDALGYGVLNTFGVLLDGQVWELVDPLGPSSRGERPVDDVIVRVLDAHGWS